MPEVMFALKSFVIAIAIMVALQIKAGNSTLETHAQLWIQTSSVPQYLQKVSAGAVLAVRNGGKAAGDFVAKTFGRDTSTQRAGRLQFDAQRSLQYKQAHPEREAQDDAENN